jgi:peptide methionine sulfoxide reductase MsrA
MVEIIPKEKATFGGGCFWGVEESFRELSGVLETEVGYMGGTMENPTNAKEKIKEITESGVYDKEIVTEVVPTMPFYRAEEYHQKYLSKRGLGTCHI